MVNSLLAGKTVDLIHRSRVVGKIVPVVNKKKTKMTLADVVKAFPKSKPLTVKEIDRIYRKAMEKKHGKYISGR